MNHKPKVTEPIPLGCGVIILVAVLTTIMYMIFVNPDLEFNGKHDNDIVWMVMIVIGITIFSTLVINGNQMQNLKEYEDLQKRQEIIHQKERQKVMISVTEKTREIKEEREKDGNYQIETAKKNLNAVREKIVEIPDIELKVFNELLKKKSKEIDKINAEYLHKIVRLKNYVTNEVKIIHQIKENWLNKKIKYKFEIPCPDGDELAYYEAFHSTNKGNLQYENYLAKYRRDFERKNSGDDYTLCALQKCVFSIDDKDCYVPKRFEISEIRKEHNFIVDRYKHLNRLNALSILMVNALLDENKLLFYEIYEKLDKLSVFQNNWENKIEEKLTKIDSKLDILNTSILQLMDVLRDVEGNIVSELQSLEKSLASEIRDMDKNLSEELSSINSKFSYSNLLNTYNTYQLYKISKK